MKLCEITRSITSHPLTTLATALILIATGAAEAWETIERDVAQANVGAHHGVLIFGLVSLIGVIPDIIEGLERLTSVCNFS
ncbi:MAG: hypothetical protein K0U74_02830 [Alphaproteobacteria bacterium]|nr:hypothetical protein [Alphaproteobacteria bacterium]